MTWLGGWLVGSVKKSRGTYRLGFLKIFLFHLTNSYDQHISFALLLFVFPLSSRQMPNKKIK